MEQLTLERFIQRNYKTGSLQALFYKYFQEYDHTSLPSDTRDCMIQVHNAINTYYAIHPWMKYTPNEKQPTGRFVQMIKENGIRERERRKKDLPLSSPRGHFPSLNIVLYTFMHDVTRHVLDPSDIAIDNRVGLVRQKMTDEQKKTEPLKRTRQKVLNKTREYISNMFRTEIEFGLEGYFIFEQEFFGEGLS